MGWKRQANCRIYSSTILLIGRRILLSLRMLCVIGCRCSDNSHSNWMQIYDVGNIEPISFIRMHWRVDQASGSNMDCAQANPKNPFIPVDIFSIKIAMQISTEFTVWMGSVAKERENSCVFVCVMKNRLKWTARFCIRSLSLGCSVDHINAHISETISNLNINQNNGKIMRFVVWVWLVLLSWWLLLFFASIDFFSPCVFVAVLFSRIFSWYFFSLFDV